MLPIDLDDLYPVYGPVPTELDCEELASKILDGFFKIVHDQYESIGVNDTRSITDLFFKIYSDFIVVHDAEKSGDIKMIAEAIGEIMRTIAIASFRSSIPFTKIGVEYVKAVKFNIATGTSPDKYSKFSHHMTLEALRNISLLASPRICTWVVRENMLTAIFYSLLRLVGFYGLTMEQCVASTKLSVNLK